MRTSVFEHFLVPNALIHLEINVATGQKRRNRVKRTENGRHALTPPSAANPHPHVDFGNANRAAGGHTKELLFAVLLLIYFRLKNRNCPETSQVPLPLAKVYPPAGKISDQFLGLKAD